MLTKNTCLKDQIIEMEESVFFHVNNLVLKAVSNAEEKMKVKQISFLQSEAKKSGTIFKKEETKRG